MIKPLIDKIETNLYDIAIEMKYPTLEGDLGVLIFYATMYKYANEEVYKEKANKLLEKLLAVFSDCELPSGFLEGFEGILYTVQYLYKCNIIEDMQIVEDLEKYLIQTIKIDFNANNYDPLHGSIGKLLYFINSESKSKEEVEELINLFIESLYKNREEKDQNIFWYDSYEKGQMINLGLAHGITGVLTFLLRLKELEYKNPKIDILIEGLLKSLMSFKNNIPNTSIYPNFVTEEKSKDISRSVSINTRLGWCSGDLGISYTLHYASKVLKRDSLKPEVINLMKSIISRLMSTSKLDHYEEYSFFDTGFCHGISGIVYILEKMNNDLKSPQIEKRIGFWKEQLTTNLEKQLSYDEEIYLPWYRQDKEKSYTLEKGAMLNGLTGVGLALASIHYKKYDWSDFFLLF